MTRRRIKYLLIASLVFGSVSSVFAQHPEWVIKPKYEAITDFSEGVAAVRLNGKWGYATDRGKELLSPEYEVAYPFSEGVGVLAAADHSLVALVDKSGNRIPVREGLKIDSRFAAFSEGLLLVVGNGGKWGYLNKSGSLSIPCKYYFAQPFSEKKAAVLFDADWYYIGTDGATVIPPNEKIYWAFGFYEGKAVALYKNGMASITANGRESGDKLPRFTPPADAGAYRQETIVSGDGDVLTMDTKGRAVMLKKKNGEETVFIPSAPRPAPAAENVILPDGRKLVRWQDPATAVVETDQSRYGVIAFRKEPAAVFGSATDTLGSVFAQPVVWKYTLRNTSDTELENLEVEINGNRTRIPSLAPGKEQSFQLRMDKTGADAVETGEMKGAVSEYGLLLAEIKRTVTVEDVPSIGIDIADKATYTRGNPSYPLNVTIRNLSDVAVDGVSVSIGENQQLIPALAGKKDSGALLFNLAPSAKMRNAEAAMTVRNPVTVSVAPPGTPVVTKSSEVSITVLVPEPPPPPPPPPRR
jgi:hypothetical protein